MHKYDINSELPPGIQGPLRFREPGGDFEGQVNSPKEILEKFEPVDVLEGAIELVDSVGHMITFHCADKTVLDNNEYPQDYQGITYAVLQG